MRVMTYVDGKLTVINNNGIYSEIASKPIFITGTNFYYEPTLKMMDGVDLTPTQIEDAETFIDNFVKPVVVKPIVEPIPIILKHCVDSDGNYIGNVSNSDGYTVVPSAPSAEYEKWYEGAWVVCCLVEATTGKYVGFGDSRDNQNYKYAPDIPAEEPFVRSNYFFNSIWSIDLQDAKKDMKIVLKTSQDKELRSVLGSTASWEVASFTKQEQEARAWLVDNLVATPFIDSLINARASGETKQSLVDKIILKADAYTMFYANQIGKFQRMIKEIDACTTVDEVKLITW